MLNLRVLEIGNEIEIEAVADPIGRGIERSNGGSRAAGLVARADANDVQHAGGVAEAQRLLKINLLRNRQQGTGTIQVNLKGLQVSALQQPPPPSKNTSSLLADPVRAQKA